MIYFDIFLQILTKPYRTPLIREKRKTFTKCILILLRQNAKKKQKNFIVNNNNNNNNNNKITNAWYLSSK